MTHVQIRNHPTMDGHQILVDGHDLSTAVLADSLRVTAVGSPTGPDEIRVSITIAADTLDVDLPEAVIQAMREAEDEGPVA